MFVILYVKILTCYRSPELEPIQEDFLNYKQEASQIIHELSNKLTDMQVEVLELEKKFNQCGVDIINLETSKNQQIENLNNQWRNKLQVQNFML